MIIRSQDKKVIVNFDNVSEVCIRDNSIGMGAIAGGVNFIGTYSTEEKAIEVLDRISKKYSRYQCLKACGRLCEEDSIFQMPSDEEVEV